MFSAISGIFNMSDTDEKTRPELKDAEAQKVNAMNKLEKLKKLMEVVDTEKSRLILEKMDSDEAKKKAQQDTTEVMMTEEQLAASFAQKMKEIKDEINGLSKVKLDLVKQLHCYEEKLKTKKTETDTLQQRFQIKTQIPETKIKFAYVEKEEEPQENEDEDIKAMFTILQRPSVLLNRGQALITFEDEKVAEQILRLSKCTVACDKSKIEVKPCSLALEPSVKFEVHIKVSKKMIKFSKAPSLLSEEHMRDRLELNFSKPSRGGGEVEKLEYDPKSGTGRVTFLNTGVAENLTLKGRFCLDIGNEIEVKVEPLYEYELKKFQAFSGVPKRTVLLKDIQDIKDEEDIQDHLEIHFQKPSNYGGEVEAIKYTQKMLRAFFCKDGAEPDK